MKIDGVGRNTVSFEGFYTNTRGAHNLAAEFVKKPALEEKFMQNLVEPLKHTKMYSVFVDGGVVNIINNQSKQIMSIIQPGSAANHTLGVVYDHKNNFRNELRSHSQFVPTNNFENDGFLLHHIETAKNIILDMENMISEQASGTYSKVAEETLEQKSNRFENTFLHIG